MAGDWHWWLVTWGTYGAWLPGDVRGFRTWRKREYVAPPARYAAADEETYDPRDYRERRRRVNKLSSAAVTLGDAQQRVALEAIVADIAELPIEPKIMAVAGEHLHLLAVFGDVRIRPTVGRLKAAATKKLKALPDWGEVKRIWAKGCHMESLESEDDQFAAYRYVGQHDSQGIVHRWVNVSQADGFAVDRTRGGSNDRRNGR